MLAENKQNENGKELNYYVIQIFNFKVVSRGSFSSKNQQINILYNNVVKKAIIKLMNNRISDRTEKKNCLKIKVIISDDLFCKTG